MIDVIAAITLTLLAAGAVGALVLTAPVERATRWSLLTGAATWFVIVTGLAAAGAFSDASPLGTPAIGLAVLAPVVLGVVGALRTSLGRRLALGIPLAILIVVNAGRLLGAFFLLLHGGGRLSPTFATTAGWGDITVAVLALPVAWLAHRRGPGWRGLALGWNAIAFVDLVVAVTLGIGSQPGAPFRFIFEAPGTALMGTLPWLLIPGFLVPLYLLTHLAVFAQLASARTRQKSSAPAWEGRAGR
jgi:hypothetical protein